MDSSTSAHDALASLFSNAYASSSTTEVPPELVPATFDDAYAVQQCFLDRNKARIGGWKVGSKSVDGPIQGAALPHHGVFRSGGMVERRNYPVLGLELEIAFCFDRDFMPRASEISEEEVMQSISTMGASIELVASRIAGWPKAPPLAQLADFQNHGALIVGDFIDYRDDFPFQNPLAHLTLDGEAIFDGVGANPAGDPRRLLGWVVNHCSRRGIALLAGTVVTGGSYTGMHFPAKAGVVAGRIAGLPPIDFQLR
ncbi:MAG: 2-keto-4-pentenoate hydratase [Herbaspirillum sp.]|jgi:2-keto-4-pentenoate hydratase|nr:2-keto-4-pentenoate hydratase [Herbaspirillum sp.]